MLQTKQMHVGWFLLLLCMLGISSFARAAEVLGYRAVTDGVEVYNTSNGVAVSKVVLSQVSVVTGNGAIAYAAFAGGIAVISVIDPHAPQLVHVMTVPLPAKRLVIENGKLSIEFADGTSSAHSLDDPLRPNPPSVTSPSVTSPPVMAPPVKAPSTSDAAASQTTPSATPTVAPPDSTSVVHAERPLAIGDVVLVRKGWVGIKSSTALSEGQRFYLYKGGLAAKPGDALSGTVPHRSGMLVIERVRGLWGVGRLERNAYAEVGDRAIETRNRFKQSLLYGERFPKTARVLVDLWTGPLFGKGVTGQDGTGGGLIGMVAFEYRFAVPLKLGLELSPLTLVDGLRTRTNDYLGIPVTVFSGGLRAVIGVALSGFELSLGLGGALNVVGSPVGAMSMGLSARFGSLDGLNLTLASSLELFTQKPIARLEQFYGAWNIPVHRRVTMAFVGGFGGSESPYLAMGTLDFYGYLFGTGGPGTWIIRTGFGGFGMRQKPICGPQPLTFVKPWCNSFTSTGGGPAFHLGLDTRF